MGWQRPAERQRSGSERQAARTFLINLLACITERPSRSHPSDTRAVVEIGDRIKS
jgi:hypothetical protein